MNCELDGSTVVVDCRRRVSTCLQIYGNYVKCIR